jgi:hypothetical protein
MTQRLPERHPDDRVESPVVLGGPLGRRTGVVVLAPVPGRRCGLDNAGAGPSSGAATANGRGHDRPFGAQGGQK